MLKSPRRRKRPGSPFTKGKARREHKSKERLFEDGQWWFSPGAAARYLEVCWATLDKWGGCCPWLGGEGVTTRPMQGGYNRTIAYYSKQDLDTIREAKAKAPRFPEVEGRVYILDAAAALGVSVRT